MLFCVFSNYQGAVSKAGFSVIATHDIMKVLKRSSAAAKGRDFQAKYAKCDGLNRPHPRQ
jgi:hypothetical protein